jgi:hypothetical protein
MKTECKHGLTLETCHYCRGGEVTFHNPTGVGAVYELSYTAIISKIKSNKTSYYLKYEEKNKIEDDLISKIDRGR